MRVDEEQDLYAVLEVPVTASAAEVSRAYRRLGRALHPDTCPDGPAAAQAFARVAAAYHVLGDAHRRAEYDRRRRQVAAPGPSLSGRRVRVTHIPARTDPLRAPDPFAATGPAGWWVPSPLSGYVAPRRTRRGEDLAGEVLVDLAQAERGATVRLPSGSAQGGPAVLPPGVVDGQRLRVPGAGRPGSGGGPPGDLHLTVRLQPPAWLTRRGADLATTAVVSFPEAVLGARVTLGVLPGGPASIEVPAGTRSGDVLRLPGRGLATVSGAGDLLVTVVIDVPAAPTAATRRALEALAQTLPCPRPEEVPHDAR
jgi:molecular chaperone DnaJ